MSLYLSLPLSLSLYVYIYIYTYTHIFVHIPGALPVRAGEWDGRHAPHWGRARGDQNSPKTVGRQQRSEREHKVSFRGHPRKGVVRCSLDSCLLPSSIVHCSIHVVVNSRILGPQVNKQ